MAGTMLCLFAFSLATIALPHGISGNQLRVSPHADEALLVDNLVLENDSDEASGSFIHRLLAVPKQIYDSISVDVAYANVWQEFYTFPERRPRTFNLIVATIKTWMADLVVQLGEQMHKPKPTIDWKRSIAFSVFGFFYEGLTCWFLYVTVFSNLCPHAITFANAPWDVKLHDHAGQFDLVKQVFLDNFMLTWALYFPCFYIIMEWVTQSEGRHTTRLYNAVTKGVSSYVRNFKEDNLASMALWIPGDFVVYSVPMFARLPLGHALSFLWTMILSRMRGEEAQMSRTVILHGECCKVPASEADPRNEGSYQNVRLLAARDGNSCAL